MRVHEPHAGTLGSGPLRVFLNREGGTYRPGPSDSLTNSTTIVPQTAWAPPADLDDETWGELVSCVRRAFGPFDVVVDDHDPSPLEHVEAVVTTSPAALGLTYSPSGLAPFDCTPLPRPITFTFTDVATRDVDNLCWVTAQEIGHTLGLDHALVCGDAMTYLFGCTNTQFLAQSGRCGEDLDRPRDCECRDPLQQSSRQHLLEVLGPGEETPPWLSLASPANGAVVAPGVELVIDAGDNYEVVEVGLTVGGALIAVDRAAPWTLRVPARIGVGPLTGTLHATDAGGTTTTIPLALEVAPECAADADCAADATCDAGVCLTGQGGLCEDAGRCATPLCAAAIDQEAVCTVPCVVGGDACPAGFTCGYGHGLVEACLPDPTTPAPESGGCAAGGEVSAAVILAVLIATRGLRRRS